MGLEWHLIVSGAQAHAIFQYAWSAYQQVWRPHERWIPSKETGVETDSSQELYCTQARAEMRR